MTYSHFLLRARRTLLVGAMALLAVAAQADIKIVAKTTVSTRRGPTVVTVTTFYKGSKVRIDIRDTTEITDSKTHKTILINRSLKNYVITSSTQEIKAAAASVKNQHMKITASIKPTGKHKMIVGRSASQYVGDLVVSGDFPKMPGSKAKADVHLDEWTTAARGVTVAQSDMLGTVGLLLRGLAGVGGMQKVTRELSKIKGIPLNINVEADVTIYSASGGAPQSQKHTFVTEAQFVNEGTFPASAFEVPKGFKLATPPKAPVKGKAPAKKK